MPLVKICLALMGGVLLGDLCPWSIWGLLVFPVIFVLNLLIPRPGFQPFRDKLWQLCYLGMILLIGHQLYSLRSVRAGNHIEGWIGQKVQVAGLALQAPLTTPYGKKMFFEVLEERSTQVSVSGKVLVYLGMDAPSIHKGDYLALDLDLKPVKSKHEGYIQYLHNKDIFCTGRAKEITLLKEGQDLISRTGHLRQHLKANTYDQMPDSSIAALSVAMLLGDKSGLNQEMKKDFAKAGLSHILAISGLHIGIVFFFFHSLLGFLRRFPGGKWVQTLLTLFILIVYAILTGCSPSVCRAVLMIGTVQLGQLIHQQSSGLNLLAGVGLLLILVDPKEMFALGFQLSFCAVAGIMILVPYFKKKLIDRWSWAKGDLLNALCVSLAAQLATAPLIAYHFGTFPTYFLLSNLLLLPLVGFGVNLGVLAMLLSPFPGLNYVLHGMLDFILWSLSSLGSWIAHLPGSEVQRISFSDLGFCLLLGMVTLFLVLWHGKNLYKWFAKPAVDFLSFGHGSRKADFV